MTVSGLNDIQTTQLEQLLQERLAQMEVEIAQESDALAEGRQERFPSGARDHGDEAQREQYEQMDTAVLARHRQDVAELRAALARIDDGSFGECLSCGGAIGFERLMVQPSAARCMVCQTRAEKN